MSSKLPVAAVGAWLLVAVYYFYQYALRSAPSVMMPQLTDAFGVNALGVSAIVGMFYYAYSPFSLVAGAAIDRFGAKRVVPIGRSTCWGRRNPLRHRQCDEQLMSDVLCRERAAFLRSSALFISSPKNFPASMAASFVGATQMFGMAGGSAWTAF
jgi:MFS family permease